MQIPRRRQYDVIGTTPPPPPPPREHCEMSTDVFRSQVKPGQSETYHSKAAVLFAARGRWMCLPEGNVFAIPDVPQYHVESGVFEISSESISGSAWLVLIAGQ
jgi:hypothetical protein